jgi:nucleotide-binding universal stress UspA family protein
LSSQIGLLNSLEPWLLCLAVLGVAIIGKYVGTYIAARACGLPKRDASALGWMMNTRGLTELIVLNIGLSFGVISPLLFTILVIMALVTTFMTSPLLELTYSKNLIREDAIAIPGLSTSHELPTYRLLVPISNPSTQKGLLQLAVAIAGTDMQSSAVYPLSLVEIEEDYSFRSTPLEAQRLITKRSQEINAVIQLLEPESVQEHIYPIVRVANDVARETAHIADVDHADLILLGWHRPAFSENRLGGRVGQVLSLVKTDVAIFIDRQPQRIEKILVPYAAGIHNDLGFELALRILVNQPQTYLQVLRVKAPDMEVGEFSYEFRKVMGALPNSLRRRIVQSVIEAEDALSAVLKASELVDLTIAGASREWGIERQTLGQYTDELAVKCYSSLLITRRYSRVTSHLAAVLDFDGATSDVP